MPLAPVIGRLESVLGGFFGLLPTGAIDSESIRKMGPELGVWTIGSQAP